MDICLPDLTLNNEAKVGIHRPGNEKRPIVIIDDVFLHPEQITAYAISHGGFTPPPEGSYYPGLNGILPSGYGKTVVDALRPLLADLFGIARTERLNYEGFFGLSTFSADKLAPLQTIPHFDSSNPRRVAMVNYFCGPPFKGTAFYRHKHTGFETINGARVEPYRQVVMEELERFPSQDYISGGTAQYEQIDYVEARFNRLVVYSTTMLHSGILEPEVLSADPAKGRLTANSFIEIRPSGT